MSQLTQYFTENLLDPTQLHLKEGTKVGIVLNSQKYSPKPPYCMVGSKRMYQNNAQGAAYPLLETMCSFTSSEGWFFQILLQTHNEVTGLSDISRKTFSKSELNQVSKAYKELNKRELVKRIKRQVYMINPSALITNNWGTHKQLWDNTP